jgi:hypothetical protein
MVLEMIEPQNVSWYAFLIVSIVFLVPGLLVTLLNYFILFRNWRTGKHSSLILLVGGFSVFVGLMFFPNTYTRVFSWASFVGDPGYWVLVRRLRTPPA